MSKTQLRPLTPMLFVFLVDEDVEMKNLVLGTQMTDSPSSFQATSLDGALYFVECFSKNLFGGSGRMVVDESVSQRSKTGDHHRTVFLTFNGTEELDLKSSWKDHQTSLFEALKNCSFEGRKSRRGKTLPAQSIQSVADKFEDFMDKFSASYFACTNRNNGYFIWNEPESILVFCLSSSRAKLDVFQTKFKNSWQRKNIFIHVNPHCYEMVPCEATQREFYAYFPVPTLRDAHQLGHALYRATTVDNFDASGMELLGKGCWAEFVSPSAGSCGLGLMKSCFAGHSRWPLPIPLTEADCCTEMPKLLTQPGPIAALPALDFDIFVVFAPILSLALAASPDGRLNLFVESQLFGPCLVGFAEAFKENDTAAASADVQLVRLCIGPMAFDRLVDVFAGKLDLSAYLRSVPQFYEHFLRAALGEVRWAGLCGGTAKSFQRSDFALPRNFSERKNAFRSASKHKFKAELTLAVERADAGNRMKSAKRNAELSTRLIPPLERLSGDAWSLPRLLNRFKLAQSVFEASCQPGNSENTLSAMLFKHCLPTQQMTDYAEGIRKRKPLRPLFTEQERDLFLILKENVYLQEEMAAAQFVSGDIFGNPFKKDRRDKNSSRAKRVLETEEIVDEIDVRELEDVETEIVIDGQVVNLPIIKEEEPSREAVDVDLYLIEDLIRSPGGATAKQSLLDVLTMIYDCSVLERLLMLSQRYKRKQLEPLIRQRLDSLIQ